MAKSQPKRPVSPQRHARTRLFQALFMTDVGGATREEAFEWIRQEELEKADREFLEERFPRALESLPQLDKLLQEKLEHWSWDRLARVDRTLLRLGAFEMLVMADLPFQVCISEVVDIAKEYGNDKSAGFINGVLDAVWKAQGGTPEGQP